MYSIRNRLVWIVALAAMPALGIAAIALTRENRPRIQIEPALIDFGEIENGEDLEAKFSIRNIGNKPLHVSRPAPSCGCMVVNRETPTGRVPVGELVVAPGERIELISGMVVRDFQGNRENNILFTSDDPVNPVVELRLRVMLRGRIVPYPATLNFGNVNLAAVAVENVRLRNTGRKQPFEIAEIRSSIPEELQVRNAPAEATDSYAESRSTHDTTNLEITFKPTKIGRLAAQVWVFEKGQDKPVLTIPISAIVAPLYEFYPRKLLLPRTSSQGPLYYIETTCRRSDQKAFQLKFIGPSKGARVFVGETSLAHEKSVRVEVDSDQSPGTYPILFMAKNEEGEGDETSLTIDMNISPKEKHLD